MATVKKKFRIAGSWTAPGGVFKIEIFSRKNALPGRMAIGDAVLSGSGFASVAMLDDYGRLKSFGANIISGPAGAGQLGDGSIVSKSSPVLVLGYNGGLSTGGPVRWKKVVSSGTSTIALDINGNLWGWGDNAFGQLGDGSVTSRSSPVLVAGNRIWRDVHMHGRGDNSVQAISDDGNLYVWGDNTNAGCCTAVAIGGALSSPTLVSAFPGKGKEIKSSNDVITAGYFWSILTGAGTVYSWGSNAFGQLGDNSTVSKSTPTLALGGFSFSQIALNARAVIATTESGQLYAWGNNTNGELALGDVVSRSTPTISISSLKFEKIASSYVSFFGIVRGGDAYAWGANTGGGLGVGDNNSRSSPVLVLGSLKFSKIFGKPSIGVTQNNSSFGVTLSGALYAWGNNEKGQLGLGDNTPRSSPVLVSGISATEVFVSQNNNYVASLAGSIYSWGNNVEGCLGTNSTGGTVSSVPTILSGPSQNINLTNPANSIVLDVIPGTTYQVTVADSFSATFGSVPVSNGPVDEVELVYEQ